jgi:hypothetical protein
VAIRSSPRVVEPAADCAPAQVGDRHRSRRRPAPDNQSERRMSCVAAPRRPRFDGRACRAREGSGRLCPAYLWQSQSRSRRRPTALPVHASSSHARAVTASRRDRQCGRRPPIGSRSWRCDRPVTNACRTKGGVRLSTRDSGRAGAAGSHHDRLRADLGAGERNGSRSGSRPARCSRLLWLCATNQERVIGRFVVACVGRGPSLGMLRRGIGSEEAGCALRLGRAALGWADRVDSRADMRCI